MTINIAFLSFSSMRCYRVSETPPRIYKITVNRVFDFAAFKEYKRAYISSYFLNAIR